MTRRVYNFLDRKHLVNTKTGGICRVYDGPLTTPNLPEVPRFRVQFYEESGKLEDTRTWLSFMDLSRDYRFATLPEVVKVKIRGLLAKI